MAIARELTGNAAKRLENRTAGPWGRWRTRSRHARAIRFIETYCRPPKGKGAGKPIRLGRFQKEWLEDVLAEGVGIAVQSIPRGNGKSTFRAAVATWAVFDPDDTGAPQVPIVATTVGQAMRSIYTPATQMIAAEPELSSRSIPFTAWGSTRVWVPSTDGEMFPIAHEVGGLQGLDPSLAVVDELAFMGIDPWVALTEASGKRDRSLVIGISTPGLDRENALWHVRKQAIGGTLIPGFRWSEYAADDGCPKRDERQWRKANPAIAAGFLRIDALRTSVELSPEAQFRAFRLGQWVDGIASWLGDDGRQAWEALRGPYKLARGAVTWAGLDVGLKRDSTALAAVQRLESGRLFVSVRLWLPRPGEPVDVTDVMEAIRELDRDFDLRAVAFDPRHFDVAAKMLLDEGLPMVEIPQSVERMTSAVGDTFVAIKRRQLAHDADPVVTEQVLGAIARHNERGFTLSKSKSRGRIDAAIAICLAVDRCLHPEEEEGELEMVVA